MSEDAHADQGGCRSPFGPGGGEADSEGQPLEKQTPPMRKTCPAAYLLLSCSLPVSQKGNKNGHFCTKATTYISSTEPRRRTAHGTEVTALWLHSTVLGSTHGDQICQCHLIKNVIEEATKMTSQNNSLGWTWTAPRYDRGMEEKCHELV